MQTSESTLYEVLGLTPSATTAEVKSAYRRLARLIHPDVGGTTTLFCKVEEAYTTLSDPALRAVYDDSLRFPFPPGRDGPSAKSGHGWEPFQDPPSGWDPRTGVPWDAHTYANSSPPPAGGTPRAALVTFPVRQPWAYLILGGLASTAISPPLGSGMFMFGLVAALGALRHRRYPPVWRHGGRSTWGLRLLRAEIVTGFSILLRASLAILGVVILVGLRSHRSSRGQRR